jgi:lipoprotein-anchoring transpeptidase ErfK/SrfK
MSAESTTKPPAQRRQRAMRALALALAIPFALAACTSNTGPTTATALTHSSGTASQSAGTGSGSSSPSPSKSTVSKVKLIVTPAANTKAVKPNSRVVVRADDGKVADVVLKTTTGKTVHGAVDANGVWRSRVGALPYSTTFTVTAQGVDAAGLSRQISSQFTTVTPTRRLTTSISPLSGATVGVGMPVIVKFSAPVTARATVERGLTVTTSRAVVGAWSWISDTEVHWRPKTYWPANTTVTVAVRLAGVHAGKGIWGDETRNVTFHIGASMISTVDVSGHKMTIVRNGKVLRTIPITTGKAGFVTRAGIKVILDKELSRIMDSTTIGIPKGTPGYYRLLVHYALRVTWSGEFVHAAPWSQASQGLANVSHGCTGMSMANAEWFYNLSSVGDIVKFIHSPRHLEPQNGWTDWNVSWATWLKGDALRTT